MSSFFIFSPLFFWSITYTCFLLCWLGLQYDHCNLKIIFLLQTTENNLTAHKMTWKNRKTLPAHFLCNILWTLIVHHLWSYLGTPLHIIPFAWTINKKICDMKKKKSLYYLLYISATHIKSIKHIRIHLQPFNFLIIWKLFWL